MTNRRIKVDRGRKPTPLDAAIEQSYSDGYQKGLVDGYEEGSRDGVKAARAESDPIINELRNREAELLHRFSRSTADLVGRIEKLEKDLAVSERICKALEDDISNSKRKRAHYEEIRAGRKWWLKN